VSIRVLLCEPSGSALQDALERVHAWVCHYGTSGASARLDSALAVHAACALRTPQRLARVKQRLQRALARPLDQVHNKDKALGHEPTLATGKQVRMRENKRENKQANKRKSERANKRARMDVCTHTKEVDTGADVDADADADGTPATELCPERAPKTEAECAPKTEAELGPEHKSEREAERTHRKPPQEPEAGAGVGAESESGVGAESESGAGPSEDPRASVARYTVHVQSAADALAAIAGVIDDAGGLAFSAATRYALARESHNFAAARCESKALAKDPLALLLHGGLRVADVLHGRHTLWAQQRAAGVQRPLPVIDALHVVAAAVDDTCLLPVLHACEGPDALEAQQEQRFDEWAASRSERKWSTPKRKPVPSCVLCWRNANLRKELCAGNVNATIPRLQAAGYEAGHLLLRRAAGGLARAATELRTIRQECQDGENEQ
jgi:hypothetical protein